MRFWPFVLAGLLVSAHARAETPILFDKVAAVVDTKFIVRSDVIDRAKLLLASRAKSGEKVDNARFHREVLEQMIDELLIKADAERRHLEVTEAEVDAAIDAIVKQNNVSRKDIEAEVSRLGMTLPQYRAELRQQLLDARWVRAVVGEKWKYPTTTDRAEAEKASAELDALRRKAVNDLRAHAFVEVRW